MRLEVSGPCEHRGCKRRRVRRSSTSSVGLDLHLDALNSVKLSLCLWTCDPPHINAPQRDCRACFPWIVTYEANFIEQNPRYSALFSTAQVFLYAPNSRPLCVLDSISGSQYIRKYLPDYLRESGQPLYLWHLDCLRCGTPQPRCKVDSSPHSDNLPMAHISGQGKCRIFASRAAHNHVTSGL